MTWTTVGSYATANSKVSGTTLDLFSPPTPGLAVGDVIVVCVASDNVQTTDGTSTLHSSVVGSFSGTFTKALEYTNGQAAAGAGATNSLWYKRITTAVLGGDDTITVTFASAITAKVANAFIFHATGSTITLDAAQGSANDTDPAAMTISGLTNSERLYIRTVATERGSYGFGASTNYTAYGADTTAAPGDATDMSIGSEYRIFTGTGDTTDPTTGTPQSASVYVALREGAGASTLTIAAGSFTVSGKTAALLAGRKLPVVKGTYAVTANAVLFTFGRTLSIAKGTFAVSAAAVLLQAARKLPIAAASYAVTPGTLNVNRAYTMPVTHQALTVSPSAIAFSVGRKLTLASGSFVLTPVAVALSRGPRTFSITSLAMLFRGRNIILAGPTQPTTVESNYQARDVGYKYTPAPPPDNPTITEALQWALQELQKAGNVINNLADGKVAVLHSPPAKPRNGMIRMADGTDWNPGSGRGYYAYDEVTATWRPIS